MFLNITENSSPVIDGAQGPSEISKPTQLSGRTSNHNMSQTTLVFYILKERSHLFMFPKGDISCLRKSKKDRNRHYQQLLPAFISLRSLIMQFRFAFRQPTRKKWSARLVDLINVYALKYFNIIITGRVFNPLNTSVALIQIDLHSKSIDWFLYEGSTGT